MGVVSGGEFWGIVGKTGLRLKGEDEKWTVFEVAGGVKKMVEEKKATAEWMVERVQEKVGKKMCYAQQWLKEVGKEKGGVSVDAMAGVASVRGWIEVKDGEASEALRQQAEDDVEKLGKVAAECEQWRSRTGKEEWEEGRKVQRPRWIAYVIVGKERWWWRERAVVDSGERKPGGAWVWKLGEWAEEKEWSRRKRGRQRGSALTEEEKKKRQNKACKEWRDRNPEKVEARWKKQQQRKKEEAAEAAAEEEE